MIKIDTLNLSVTILDSRKAYRIEGSRIQYLPRRNKSLLAGKRSSEDKRSFLRLGKRKK